ATVSGRLDSDPRGRSAFHVRPDGGARRIAGVGGEGRPDAAVLRGAGKVGASGNSHAGGGDLPSCRNNFEKRSSYPAISCQPCRPAGDARGLVGGDGRNASATLARRSALASGA